VPAMISLQQLRESIAAVIGPQTSANNVKITVVDLHADEAQLTAPVNSGNKTITYKVSQFFKGGSWSVISKILLIIGIGIALLLVAIIALNFLGAAANRDYDTEIDPSLGDDFEDVLNESYEPDEQYQDYGESDALRQQEELLKEMMQGSGDPREQATTQDAAQVTGTQDDENVEFENLLNNFQSVASAKPEALAKKIQVWLEDES